MTQADTHVRGESKALHTCAVLHPGSSLEHHLERVRRTERRSTTSHRTTRNQAKSIGIAYCDVASIFERVQELDRDLTEIRRSFVNRSFPGKRSL